MALSRKAVMFIAAAVLVISAAAYLLMVWRSAQNALTAGAASAAHSGEMPVLFLPYRSRTSAFQPVDLPIEYASQVRFDGDLYKLSPGAVSTATQVWRVGRELPPAPLLEAKVRTGAAQPELWISTDGAGVLIYDGHLLRQLMPHATPLRKISAMLPLSNGQVLLGTPTAGLYVTDGRVLRLFHPSFSTTQVTALAGNEDQFWVGTRADGVWQWKGGTAVHFLKDLPDPQVLSLAAGEDTAWVGTALGITEFRAGKFHRQLGKGLFAKSISLGKDETLQVETLDQGTQTIALTARQPRPQRNWIAASESGDSHPLPTPQHISALHHDARGNLWIGYFDRGLDILSERGIDHREDDHLFCINRIREQAGVIAVATANGLAFFDSNRKLRQVLDRGTGLIASQVSDVLFTPTSTVVATAGGLSFIDRGVSSLYAFGGLVNNHVYTLAEDAGTLYAGTLGGVSEIRNGQVEASFTTANSQLRQNWITAAERFGGKLYLGTYGSGVVIFGKTGDVIAFPAFAQTRTEINLNAMTSTPRALYVGTAGRGLAILPAGEERWRFITDGLPSLNVTAVECYGGTLYAGTDNGLVQIAESRLLP